MIRQIIKIDEEKCNGCGLCVTACHEGAIGLVNGKAKLLRDDYCDGLGNCLPVCPTNAISFEEREAEAFDAEAVKQNLNPHPPKTLPCGCPGTQSKSFERNIINHPQDTQNSETKSSETQTSDTKFSDTLYSKTQSSNTQTSVQTHLNQWPVQIKLVPINAPYFENANLLISADCAAYAYGNFHTTFMRNKITLIGCPKLDDGDYSEKLTAILKHNTIKSVTVVRMEVPCCGGIENAVKTALKNCDKLIPWQVVTISTDGRILEI